MKSHDSHMMATRPMCEKLTTSHPLIRCFGIEARHSSIHKPLQEACINWRPHTLHLPHHPSSLHITSPHSHITPPHSHITPPHSHITPPHSHITSPHSHITPPHSCCASDPPLSSPFHWGQWSSFVLPSPMPGAGRS